MPIFPKHAHQGSIFSDDSGSHFILRSGGFNTSSVWAQRASLLHCDGGGRKEVARHPILGELESLRSADYITAANTEHRSPAACRPALHKESDYLMLSVIISQSQSSNCVDTSEKVRFFFVSHVEFEPSCSLVPLPGVKISHLSF